MFKAEILSYEDIRSTAEKFLDKYVPDRQIPIPIEEIVEFELDIQIIPLPYLKRRLNDIEACMFSNMEEIAVDQNVLENIPLRYRFTLAHEIGHYVLHRSIYESASFANVDEWIEFNSNMPEKEHSWFEYQADAFAGLLLVPNVQFLSKINSIKDKMQENNIDIQNLSDRERVVIIEHLSSYFSVSKYVISWRLKKEEDIAQIKLI